MYVFFIKCIYLFMYLFIIKHDQFTHTLPSPIIKHDEVTLTLRSPMTGVFHYAKWTNTELSINFNCTAQTQNFACHCNFDQRQWSISKYVAFIFLQHNFFI